MNQYAAPDCTLYWCHPPHANYKGIPIPLGAPRYMYLKNVQLHWILITIIFYYTMQKSKMFKCLLYITKHKRVWYTVILNNQLTANNNNYLQWLKLFKKTTLVNFMKLILTKKKIQLVLWMPMSSDQGKLYCPLCTNKSTLENNCLFSVDLVCEMSSKGLQYICSTHEKITFK